MTQCDRYEILHANEAWRVVWNGLDLGSFTSQVQALQAARVAARVSRNRGSAVEILIENNGTLSVIDPAALKTSRD
jgi:hypothetical protein